MRHGVEQLGYLIFDIAPEHAKDMKRIFTELMESNVIEDEVGCSLVKLDGRAFRIMLRPAVESRLAATGWEVADTDTLSLIVDKVQDQGLPVNFLNGEELRVRGISVGVQFLDHNGSPIELFVDAPFSADEKLAESFVCRPNYGFGHIVHICRDRFLTKDFYKNTLGFRVSDRITWDAADLFFLHCNRRHHSIALAGEVFGLKAGMIDHFMIEAASIEQVKRAWARLPDLGFKVSMTLGQHSNDKMTSFYIIAPTGFRIEFGYGGVEAEGHEENQVPVYDRPSDWGHELVM